MEAIGRMWIVKRSDGRFVVKGFHPVVGLLQVEVDKKPTRRKAVELLNQLARTSSQLEEKDHQIKS